MTQYSLFHEAPVRESYSRDGMITYDKEAIELNKKNTIKCIFYYGKYESKTFKIKSDDNSGTT